MNKNKRHGLILGYTLSIGKLKGKIIKDLQWELMPEANAIFTFTFLHHKQCKSKDIKQTKQTELLRRIPNLAKQNTSVILNQT